MTTIPVKYVAKINAQVLPESTAPDREFEYIDISAVGATGGITAPAERMAFGNSPSRARRIAAPGSTIVSTVRTYLRAIAYVDAPLASRAIFSTGFAVLEPDSSFDPRFFHYACRAEPFIGQVVARSVGVSYPAIPPNDLGDIEVPIPTLDAQRLIADFLDDQVARIDEVIRLREQQIASLATRTETACRNLVTSGQPDRMGTGSEIQWLGRVEADWNVAKIGQIARLYGGTSFPHDFQGLTEGDLPFVKVADFAQAGRTMRLSTANNWISRATSTVLGAKVLPAGSIVFARVGAALLLNQRRLLTREAIVDDNVRGLLPKGDPVYLLHVLRLLDFGQMANPGPVPTVAEPQIRSIDVPMPPLETQKTIASMADRLLETESELKEQIVAQVQLLQERKRSLITAAVTGEFDVTTAAGRGVA